jgi:heme A synthase
VGVALHLEPLVDAVGRHDVAAAGQGAAGAVHHGELVAGRRAAHAGLDVPVCGPAHQATVELAVLDDAAIVQRLHRIAKALYNYITCMGEKQE